MTAPDLKPTFYFDRYINGVKMAEDVCVERETTLEGAMLVAARIASKGPNGEAPVLVYRAPVTHPAPDAAARQDAKEAEAYAWKLEEELRDTQDRANAFATKEYYTEMRAERAEAKLAKAVKLLEAWGDVAVHCSIEEGVCCCGDNMENHTNPMDCGHTPLDHGTYIAIQLAEETRATLAEIKGESHE